MYYNTIISNINIIILYIIYNFSIKHILINYTVIICLNKSL